MPDAPGKSHDAHLAEFLADRDEPCPACTYNLRGLKTSRCPECNRELVLQLRLAEPRLGAWIAALVGTCLMLGFNGLLSLYFLLVVMWRMGSRETGIATSLFASTGVAAAALFILLRRRRWFCNLSSASLLVANIVVWGLTALSTLIFFWFAR